MEVLFQILNLIQTIFFIYFSLATLYILIFAIGGLFRYRPKIASFDKDRKFAILLPAYKEDAVILESASDALQQNYPRELFDVIVIADSLKAETIQELKNQHVILFEVSFKQSTKSKALNKAMDQLTDLYDFALILDADNIMEKDFLYKINKHFTKKFIALQCHRTAKNINTPFAILDAVSEEINNHIFRKGHRVLGFSSAIIGSGMAFDYKFFKNLMNTIDVVAGFDKEIELKILRNNYKIDYLEDAYVYDEKVQQAEVFSTQREKWLSAQIHYFKRDLFQSIKHLFANGNIDYFEKIIQFSQPPRILLLGTLVIINILSLLFNNHDFKMAWLCTLVGCILAFFFSIPLKFYNSKTIIALATLPKGFILMFLSLLKVRNAKKEFSSTKHTGKKEI
ncbi:MAG: glycosyltransferase family 2 protein [Bacteroidales bacterium]|nr:glycosyltransferase family 2 protein [Bacteroidales bacterium]